MTKLIEFSNYGLMITWSLINIGYRGSEIFKEELTAEEIINYSISRVVEEDDNPLVFELACEFAQNRNEVAVYVEKLTIQENKDYEIEFRKWRVLYVINHLPNPNMEYVKGLLELGDIWAFFNFPKDSPHVYQGRNNKLTPNQYYTQENFDKLLEKHREWIVKEIDFLQKA